LLGFALILYLLMVRRKLVDVGHQPFAEFVKISRKILHIGLPAAGANMLTPLAMAILTALMASYGAEAVAAFGVGARIESIASLVVLALSMTLPPFVSQNYGACAYHRIDEAYRRCIKFILAWQLLAVHSVLYLDFAFRLWLAGHYYFNQLFF
jgi:Na+-driven multidrug efflux pump